MAFDIFRSEHQDSIRLATDMGAHDGIVRLNGTRGTTDTLVVIAHHSEVAAEGVLSLSRNIQRTVFNPATHTRILCIVCWGANVADGQLSSFGQALANETRVTVRAATGTVNGLFENPLDLNTEGVWVDLQPQNDVDALTEMLSNLHL